MFDFSHTEDAASDHLLIFEMCTLNKDIKLNDGTILLKGREFDAIWWHLKDCSFQFIDWVLVASGKYEPKENFKCTQALLMDQGWWQIQR